MDRVQMTWVNHASYTLKYGDVHLICDPWLFGSAFNEGWDLLVESRFAVEDFDSITHIWFSHEHPDHFAPRVLSQIPADVRQRITVLFQQTGDKRVVGFCRKLGFQVQELPDRRWVEIAEDFSVMCGTDGPLDSWALFEVDGLKILNVNDCVIHNQASCQEVFGFTGEVDVLLTQFSYANWVGNPEDVEMREKSAAEKLRRVQLQADVFQPQFTVPFASFVYFSHAENRYLNDRINTVERADRFIKQETKSESVVLYPGDEWDCRSPVDNRPALALYASAYATIDQREYRVAPEPKARDYLLSLSEKYLSDIRESNSRLLMKMLQCAPRRFGFRLLTMRLMDTGDYCTFDWSRGLQFIESPGEIQEDICLSTESLEQILKFQWGIGSVLVNGRYRGTEATTQQFRRIFMIGLLNSTDKYISFRLVFDKAWGYLRGKDVSEEYSLFKSWNRWLHQPRQKRAA